MPPLVDREKNTSDKLKKYYYSLETEPERVILQIDVRPVSMGFMTLNIINFADDMVRREKDGVSWDVRRVSSP